MTDQSQPPEQTPERTPEQSGSPDAGGAPLDREERQIESAGWQRLDPRMLVVGPIIAVRAFIVPLLLTWIGIGASRGFQPWLLLTIAAPLAFGLIPWFTTRYRLTPSQFQLHKGLISKNRLSAPLDRVRSVDLESSLLHRVLGLAKVKIGTGVDDGTIELDAISVPQAEELRAVLLRRHAQMVASERGTATAGPSVDRAPGRPLDEATGEAAASQPASQVEQELSRIDWSWLRFAPLSLSRLAIVAAAIGALFQFTGEIDISQDTVDRATGWITSFAIWLVVVVVAVGILIGWLIISVVGYVVQWWNYRLVRESGTVRMTAGLLTTRSTTLEERRIRGARLSEPILLRAAHGAELAGVATGVEEGIARITPACPLPTAQRIAADLLEDPEPMTAHLLAHGPRARRRCHVRGQWGTPVVLALGIVPIVLWDFWWWPVLVATLLAIVIGALCAESTYRNLGHRLSNEYLVAGSGILTRRRTALERDGIIGWVVQQSWFQRRQGLASLVATTAAGDEAVVVRDLALGDAVAFADAATPGMLTPFLRSEG